VSDMTSSPRKLPAGRSPVGPGRPAPVTPAPGAGNSLPPLPSLPGAAEGGPGVRQAPVGGEAREGPAGTSPVADAMSENELDEHVRRIIADLPGVLRYHTFDSRKSPSGFPDLVITGPGGVLFRELKTQRGRVTVAQETWLRTLVLAGADACCWRPDDLLTGRIARRLAAISGLGKPRLTRAREADSGGPNEAAG
jgi:hypothetical protein